MTPSLVFAVLPLLVLAGCGGNDESGEPVRPEVEDEEESPEALSLSLPDTAAAAGTDANPVPIVLANPESVGGVQLDFVFDPEIVASVDSVSAEGRAAEFDGTDSNEVAEGRIRAILFDGDGEQLPSGVGVVLDLYVTIESGAAGEHELRAEGIRVAAPDGTSSALADATGQLTVR